MHCYVDGTGASIRSITKRSFVSMKLVRPSTWKNDCAYNKALVHQLCAYVVIFACTFPSLDNSFAVDCPVSFSVWAFVRARVLSLSLLLKVFILFLCGPLFDIDLTQGWGTYLLSRAAWSVDYRWRAAKSINFILKLHLYLTTRKNDSSWLPI